MKPKSLRRKKMSNRKKTLQKKGGKGKSNASASHQRAFNAGASQYVIKFNGDLPEKDDIREGVPYDFEFSISVKPVNNNNITLLKIDVRGNVIYTNNDSEFTQKKVLIVHNCNTKNEYDNVVKFVLDNWKESFYKFIKNTLFGVDTELLSPLENKIESKLKINNGFIEYTEENADYGDYYNDYN